MLNPIRHLFTSFILLFLLSTACAPEDPQVQPLQSADSLPTSVESCAVNGQVLVAGVCQSCAVTAGLAFNPATGQCQQDTNYSPCIARGGSWNGVCNETAESCQKMTPPQYLVANSATCVAAEQANIKCAMLNPPQIFNSSRGLCEQTELGCKALNLPYNSYTRQCGAPVAALDATCAARGGAVQPIDGRCLENDLSCSKIPNKVFDNRSPYQCVDKGIDWGGLVGGIGDILIGIGK